MLTKYGRLAVAELAFYCPQLFINFWAAYRSAFSRSTGWIYLCFLPVIRIIGAAIELQSEQTPREPLIKVAAIAASVGIAPLVMFMSWSLMRISKSSKAPSSILKYLFIAIYALVIAAVILAIIGGATATYSTAPFHAKPVTKAAVVILIAVFAALALVDLFLIARPRLLPRGETVPLVTVTLAAPFLASRLVYAGFSAFDPVETFNPIAGNVWIDSFVSVLEEFVAVILYQIACFWTPLPVSPSRSTEADVKAEAEAGQEDAAPSTKSSDRDDAEMDGGAVMEPAPSLSSTRVAGSDHDVLPGLAGSKEIVAEQAAGSDGELTEGERDVDVEKMKSFEAQDQSP